ncbi:ABC transporter ATP-binding protein [Halobacillus shinanisalinarum]|uniref:ABC transporter ATP-binding protein n=1 Tax=Halobacillus shinanisalinarum TaxID=2932258 RepID=A0ABY4GUB5_9BACI|nr:ABC transporter ATP-binding protein [Halobacillus shinanisalinarum]UOQ91614.1 ABC transporter ATP-binding protein [Halobacillus shinanisalinarum]
MIKLNNLFKRYGDKPVVDNVSISVPKGKITTFIGPNGAGKSTLLSMISRLITRDEGEVYIEESEIGNWKTQDLSRKLAILKQSNHIHLRLTVRELVSFGRFPYSKGRLTKEDEEKVDQALEFVALQDREDQYLEHLSGGQRQRAYIAMVIAQDTDYVLLDEPLNNLDMNHSVQVMKTLKRLVHELGKTVVLVVHDINFASVYSDYIVALKNGEIVREGSTEEMIQSNVLNEIYDMDIDIRTINDNRICVYF